MGMYVCLFVCFWQSESPLRDQLHLLSPPLRRDLIEHVNNITVDFHYLLFPPMHFMFTNADWDLFCIVLYPILYCVLWYCILCCIVFCGTVFYAVLFLYCMLCCVDVLDDWWRVGGAEE